MHHWLLGDERPCSTDQNECLLARTTSNIDRKGDGSGRYLGGGVLMLSIIGHKRAVKIQLSPTMRPSRGDTQRPI